MEKIKLRIDGIYDKKTLSSLATMGVSNFSFDFRPLSLNFLQQYKFLEMLKMVFQNQIQTRENSTIKYFLHYANAKELEINKMIDDIKTIYKRESDYTFREMFPSNFYFEFSDQLDNEYYKQFGLNYYLHYFSTKDLKKHLRCPKFKGLIIPYYIIEGHHNAQQLNSFLKNLLQLIYQNKQIDFEIILLVNWDTDILPSLFDYFDFDMVSVPINNIVEISYRNVDINKVSDQLLHLKNSI